MGDNQVPQKEAGRDGRETPDSTPNPINRVEVDVAPAHSKRSPAFQFYPSEFLSSPKVSRMSMTERGAYITLLCHCWLDSGLPTDLSDLADYCDMKPDQFARMWKNGRIGRCFVERGGKLHNERLDKERKKQADYRRRQSDAAAMRWHATASHGKASSSLISSDLISSDLTSVKPSDDTSPAFLTFPTSGKGPKAWALTENRIAGWSELYPGVDVRAECRRALAWIGANGTKTAKGMPSFLVRWLNRATDRPRPQLALTGTEGRGRTGAPERGKYDNIGEQD